MDPDSTFSALLDIQPEHFDMNTHLILGVLILILLLFTAIIAGSEVAFFSLSAKDINAIKQKESPTYQSILNLIEKPKHLLATLLIANNFLSIGVIITTNLLFTSLFHPEQWFPTLNATVLSAINLIFQVVLVTFFLVLFGEVLPKVYATQNNLRLCLFTAPLIKLLDKVCSPISNFLVHSTSFIEGRFASKKSEVSNEDMENAIELTVGHTATKEEVNIFKGILKFGEITAKQIMRTRLDIVGVDSKWTFEEVKKQVLDSGFSRLPVYNNTLDEIQGVLYSKDLLPYSDHEDMDWHLLIRPPFFVHETKMIKPLLNEFQKKHSHMAFVVDEFGGTSGLLTLEDIMEEIIGEIKDEFDEDEMNIRKLDDHNFIFEGKTLINDVCRAIAIPIDSFDEVRGESDSVAGLVLELAGKFPSQNEVFTYRQYQFIVIQLAQRRIQKIKLTIGN